jgi:hypothetical protein
VVADGGKVRAEEDSTFFVEGWRGLDPRVEATQGWSCLRGAVEVAGEAAKSWELQEDSRPQRAGRCSGSRAWEAGEWVGSGKAMEDNRPPPRRRVEVAGDWTLLCLGRGVLGLVRLEGAGVEATRG